MVTTRLRKVDGSVVLTVPPALLDALGLAADKLVALDLKDGGLVVRPAQPRYTLDELLAQGEAGPLTDEDRAWLDDVPTGRELI